MGGLYRGWGLGARGEVRRSGEPGQEVRRPHPQMRAETNIACMYQVIKTLKRPRFQSVSPDHRQQLSLAEALISGNQPNILAKITEIQRRSGDYSVM